MNKKPVFTRA